MINDMGLNDVQRRCQIGGLFDLRQSRDKRLTPIALTQVPSNRGMKQVERTPAVGQSLNALQPIVHRRLPDVLHVDLRAYLRMSGR